MNNQATTLRNDLIKIRKHLEITSIYFKEDGDNNRRIFIYPSDDIIDLGRPSWFIVIGIKRKLMKF